MERGSRKRNVLFSWDGDTSETTVMVRRMLYDHPRYVLRDYPRSRLKELFLKKIHLFQKHDRSFWKLVLEVSDEELEKAAEGNFREKFRKTYRLWPH